MEVADGIHRLTKGVTNFYLIEEGGSFTLVDAGAPKDWDLLTRTLTSMGRRVDDLDAVLLTHAHADHTGFAERARTSADARVWIHADDAEAARTGKAPKNDGKVTSYLLKPTFYSTVFSLVRRGGSKVIPVAEVSTFADGDVVDVPGKPRAIHAPGHTAGSAGLFLEGRRVLLSGDVIVTWNPLTGRAGPQIMPSAFNRDTQQALRSVDVLDGLAADVLLPGHGDPWTAGTAEAARAARAAGPS